MSKGIASRLFKGDKIIWGVFFSFCLLSLIEVFSASSRQTYDGSYWDPIAKHTVFVIAGVFVAWFMHNMNQQWIKGATKAIYIAGIIMLLYALTPFGGITRNGSTRWIYLGFEFQHFEVVKLGVVMIVALILSKAQTKNGTFFTRNDAMALISRNITIKNDNRDFTMIAILASIAFPLIFILAENLSTVIILFVVTLAMMFIGRVNGKHMALLTGSGLLAMILGAVMLLSIPEEFKHFQMFGKPIGSKVITWKHRLQDVFTADSPQRPEDVKLAGEDQRVYSKVAIAEGGIFGRGPGNSVRRDYIPHAYSDFIFAIIVEELGFVGAVFIILLYLTLLFRCGRIAKECDDPYAAFLVIGIGILITIQALMHMTISVSNFVTGQPLPLMSEGGTSFLVNSMYIGIILSVSRYVNKLNKEKNNL